MNIKSVEHSFYATTINCNSGKCMPPRRETIINEKMDVKVEVGSGIVVNVQLSKDEMEYFKQIVFAKAKAKLSKLNVEVTD